MDTTLLIAEAVLPATVLAPLTRKGADIFIDEALHVIPAAILTLDLGGLGKLAAALQQVRGAAMSAATSIGGYATAPMRRELIIIESEAAGLVVLFGRELGPIDTLGNFPDIAARNISREFFERTKGAAKGGVEEILQAARRLSPKQP